MAASSSRSGVDELDAVDGVGAQHGLDEALVARRDAERPRVVADERAVERRPRGERLGRRQQRVVDGVAEAGDDAHVGLPGVDAVVHRGQAVDALGPQRDDLLEHEVGAVESEAERVGSERPERLLATDEVDVEVVGRRAGDDAVEDDPPGHPVPVVPEERVLRDAGVVEV
jgi:hypothetical protein